MSFQSWYSSNGGEVNQQTDPAVMGFKCIAHGCNQARPSSYNTVYCKDHLSSVQQLPRYISQPRPDITNTRVESHIGTWELNPRMSGENPHIEVTPIFPERQTPRYTNYEAGVDDIPGDRHVICGTHSKSYPLGEYIKHWREHHNNEVSALRDINPSMNLLRMNYPQQPSPTLPPMRTTPPEQGKELTSSRPHGQYQEVLNPPANMHTHPGIQARVYQQPMAPTSTQPKDAGFGTQHHSNPSNKPPRTNQVYPNKRPNPHAPTPRQGPKQGPKQVRNHKIPAQPNNPTAKRNVVIVDLTIEPSPPPPEVAPQARRHHDPTEQVEKASQTPNVLVHEPPQEPLNQKKRRLEPETPITTMPPIPSILPPTPPVLPVPTERDFRAASPPKTTVEDEQRLPPSATQIAVSRENSGNTALERRDIPGPIDEQNSVDPCDTGAIQAPRLFSEVRDEPSSTDQNESSSVSFDSSAFDVLIYQQDEAGSPPPGVSLPNARSSPSIPQNSDGMLYLHVNPSIHRPYIRSQQWSERKATEIQMRPRRKHWFGKAAERQRWVWSQMEANESGHPGESTRRDPQPWTYDRPLDYGDVPPEKLPQDVLDDPAWVKACAWHRETQQMEYLRRAERQRQAEQTRQYFRSLLNASSIIQKASHQQSMSTIIART